MTIAQYLNFRNSFNPCSEAIFQNAFLTFLLILFNISMVNSQDFYRGVDLSYVNELEECGAVYYENEVATDPYSLFVENGANLARFRLWHTPDWTSFSTFADVEKSIKRSKDAGMEVILDFHYSDTWTDPASQDIPAAWQDVQDLETLGDSLYNYTYTTLRKLGEKDLMPEFVQLGNEINGNILLKEGEELYPVNWARNKLLINRAADAVDAINTEYSVAIKTILHVAQPENAVPWFTSASENGIDNYDIIGLSYYPGWSTLSMRQAASYVQQLKEVHNKEVLIVETGYPWTLNSKDEANNVLGQANLLEEYGEATSVQTQSDFLIELTYLVKENGGLGVVYWEPTWVSTDCETRWGQGSHYENATFFDFDNNLHDGSHFLNYDYTIEPEALQEKEVKFTVQMEGADTSNGVFITGDFTGEPWQFAEMEHVQGRIFEYTATVPGRSQGAYIFYNMDSWLNAYREEVPLSCALYWDDHRKYVIRNEHLNFEYKWSSCAAVDWSDDGGGLVLSTSDFGNNLLKIYPNPVSDRVNILDLMHGDQVKLYDAAGSIIPVSLTQTDSESILDIRSLKKGLYILEIHDKIGRSAHKLIKE